MKFILWFKDISMKSLPSVGGKNASLGEMYQHLTKKGVKIPDGFAITADAYWNFLDYAGIRDEIKKIFKGLDTKDMKNLSERGYKVRQTILQADFSPELKEAIFSAYCQLGKKYGRNIDVAVRSSATAEDLPTASFAGQLESYLNIRGEQQLLKTVKKCFASLFTNRAIAYRQEKGFGHLKVALSVGVQLMVRSDKASAGVMFSIDTETGFQNSVLINANYGLGESVVQGQVNPDQYYIFKPALRKNFRPIIGKKLGTKKIKVIYNFGDGKSTKTVGVPFQNQRNFVLSDDEVLKLSKWACLIEDYYKKPMDIEWAKDGRTEELFIVQARPETIHTGKAKNILEEYILSKKGKFLITGTSVGTKIGQGTARVIKDVSQIGQFQAGEVLVTEMTDPDWMPVMKIASAIVTDSGGRTCHAAIVSRELGTPCLVGTGKGTEVIKNRQKITVSCAEGEEGKVYQGLLPFKIRKTNLTKIKKPKIQIMMNIGNPDLAFDFSFIPNDGVGLARLEFIINDWIKIHPLALINYKKENSKIKRKIDELTYGYTDKTKFYVDKLAEGIGRIAAAFWPKDVIVRTSDFKSNEYANLIGGKKYEPEEANPMLGWRGASRYYDPKFKPAFLLECAAIKKVRETMGLKNVIVMIPFCRTVEEGRKVLEIMAGAGLKRSSHFKVYIMVEIPSNVILLEEFARYFDGFSIGSNDLTQLTLGLDRDSGLVSHIYDERNQAVKDLISQAIRMAKKKKKKIGICGQAPSDYPDFARFLIKGGIDSISLNPDSILKTILNISKYGRRKEGLIFLRKGKI